MSPFSTLRRFSRSSTRNKDPQSPGTSHSKAPSTGATSLRSSGGTNTGLDGHPYISSPIPQQTVTGGSLLTSHQNGISNDMRPTSSGTDGSFDFANRPVTNHQHQPMPTTTAAMMPPSSYASTTNSRSALASGSGLSRTDQIVLKHFWDFKFKENETRDLHYLKFPYFPQYPSHNDLLPYCEIYHLIKTSPGAAIISLGSANGVYIGFELSAGSQLHIDMDDEWHNIAHYRVTFKSFENMIRDGTSENVFKTWPKPLTIEFLEEEYQKWCLDLMSLCWEGKEVRELGGVPAPTTPSQHSQSLPSRQPQSSSNNGTASTGQQHIPAAPAMANGNLANGSKRF